MILISSMNEEDQTSKCSVTSGNFLVEEKNTLSKLYKAKKKSGKNHKPTQNAISSLQSRLSAWLPKWTYKL